MGGNNAYLKQRENRMQKTLEIGEDMGMQKMWDYVQIALRDPEIMGKDTFGKKRLQKLFEKLKELADQYHTAFTTDKEADYMQEKLDDALREIWGSELVEYKERYPYVKQITYEKSKKGWK